MGRVESHRDLMVWQKAMKLVVECYKMTQSLPDTEKFGLTSQIRRAVVSIPSNIAEGKARGFTKAYLNHLSIANCSVAELDTQIELCFLLSYISEQDKQKIQHALEEVGRMISGLRNSLSNS